MKPTLSIIIVNFNTEKLVLDCLESLKKDESKIAREIIVVDNGSTDGSAAAIRNYQRHFPNLHLIANKENLGFAKASNQGIKIAKGAYILLLNSDTKVKKGSLDKLYEYAKNKKDVGVVVPRLLNPDGSVQGSVFKLPTFWRAVRQNIFGKKKLLDKYAPEESSGVEAASMAAFLITPAAFKKVGFLDERYFFYFEDLDYCRKVGKAGLKVHYLSTSEVIHKEGASGKGIADEANQWRRLIPSSKIYHGRLKHYLIFLVSWLGQKSVPLLLLFTLPVIWSLLRPGYFSMQDDLQAFRIQQMSKCFQDRQIPCRWVPDAGYQYGYPQFNFYPPSVYYFGAALHLFGIQYIDSVKILFILGYFLSALTMFILVDSLLGSWPALVSAALYTYIPYKAVEVYVRGALSEFWSLVFFPLIFWSSYCLIKSTKNKYLILFSVSVALLAITHSLMTMIFLPFCGIWILFWLYQENKWKLIPKLIFGGLLGFGLSAFFFLPVILERKFVHVESLLSGYFDYRQHFVNLYKIFLSREWGYGSSGFANEILNLSVGLVQWILGGVAGLLAVFNYKKNKNFSFLTVVLLGLGLLSLFLMHQKSSFIWSQITLLSWLQFPWRFLAVSIFLFSILSGLAVSFAGRFKKLLGGVAIAAAVILYIGFFHPKDWLNITDKEKFSGSFWEKQLTISIFDYLPIYAKLPPWSKAPAYPEVLEGRVDFLSYDKGSNYQKSEVEVIKNALVRLPLFDFPGMKVLVDGEKVDHWHDDCRNERYCLGLITFRLPAGKHKISVRLYDTPVRKIGNLMTIFSLGTIIYLGVKSKNK